MDLHGKVVDRRELTQAQIASMFALMDEFYDNMDFIVFQKDLADKDYCLVLFDEKETLAGFTTQKILPVQAGSKTVWGVFSGDTIIHKAYWGSAELFKVFAAFFFDYAKRYDSFYWFLIVKGYKTYKILSTFFLYFYPNCGKETPDFEKSVIDAYGRQLFGGEYNAENGVIEYRGTKDALKQGVADIDEHVLRDRNAAFFSRANPGYVRGHDLACLAELNENNIKPALRKMLFGK